MGTPKYKRLKNELRNNDISYSLLSKKIKPAQSTISAYMAEGKPFDMDSIYAICDLLRIDPVLIPIFFPRNGDDLTEKQVNQYLQKIVIDNPPISLQRMQIVVMSDDVQFRKAGE